MGDEAYLLFGRELHAQYLENKSVVKLSKEDKAKIKKMLEALRKDKTAIKLHKGSLKEVRFTPMRKIGKVKVKVILDMHKPKVKKGGDLKSTSCRTWQSFFNKAIEYGYFNQADLYIRIDRLKEFLFIAPQKKEPHQVFSFNVMEHKILLRTASKENDFLLYLFDNYQNELPE